MGPIWLLWAQHVFHLARVLILAALKLFSSEIYRRVFTEVVVWCFIRILLGFSFIYFWCRIEKILNFRFVV